MKLVVMTQPTFFVEEDKIIASLFDEGLDALHLFKPGSSPMYSERLLTLLADDICSKITVHGNFYLKEEYKLRGIHIDDATTPAPEAIAATSAVRVPIWKTSRKPRRMQTMYFSNTSSTARRNSTRPPHSPRQN